MKTGDFMKARVQRPKPMTLVYGVSEDKQNGILKLLERFRIEGKVVSEDETNQQIGFLCGWNGFLKNNITPLEIPKQECLVFCAIDGETLNRLLSAMRNSGLSVDLKAVVTPSNQSWKLCDLIAELEREHKTMHN